MSELPRPEPPNGLNQAGRRLWTDVLADYHLETHELFILTQACRTADRLDRLADEGKDAELTLTNTKGDPIANPLLTEARQQSIVFTRLIASLRLPSDDTEIRPQRRGAARGSYGFSRDHFNDRWRTSS